MVVCGNYGEIVGCLYGNFVEKKELELRKEAEGTEG